MSDVPFSRRTAILLASVMLASLLVFLFLFIWGPGAEPGGEPGGLPPLVSSWSTSALGHAAFRALLDELEVPVSVSRFRSGERAGESAVLVILEPGRGAVDPRAESLKEAVGRADRVLIVLPKWQAGRSIHDPTEVGSPVTLLRAEEVGNRLARAGIDGEIVRPKQAAPAGEGYPAATVAFPQLVSSADLRPLVSGPEGILLGEVRGRPNRVWVLSDPDVLANHGLHRGANAVFAIRMLDALAGGRRLPVLIDETFHGYFRPPRVHDELLRFPLVVVMIHLVLLLGALFWAGSGRFGAPIREAEGIRSGKEVLVGNLADLLLAGARTPEVLAKYFRLVVAAAAHRAGIGGDIRSGATVARLARLATERGVSVDLEQVRAKIKSALASDRFEEGRVLALARAVHRWKKEFLDES